MRLNIGTKIFVALLVFFLEILGLIYVFSMVNRYHEKIMHYQHEGTARLDLVKSLQLALTQVVMPVNDFLIPGGGPNEPDNFRTLNAKTEDLIENLDKQEFDGDEERELINHIREGYSQIKKIALEIFSMPDAIGNTEAGRLMEKMDKIANDASEDAERFHQLAHRRVEQSEIDMESVKNRFDLVILIAILSNIIMISSILFFFRYTISLPLRSMRDVVIRVSRGNLDERINIRSNDEIGDLAVTFNKMAEELKRLLQKEKELTAAEHIKTVELEKAYKRLKETQDMLIQAEKLNAVGQLASGVAHEVKNPLGIIIQGVDYLEKRLSPKEKDSFETLGMIKDSVKRADKIISALLDFSKASKLDLKPEDINSILENSLTLVKANFKFEKIDIIKEAKRDIPKVLVDKTRIEQVFVNLILNAVQAMPEGGKVIIRSYDKALEEARNGIGRREGDHFRIGEKAVIAEVEDTGTGIPEENLKKIFDPFFTTKGPRGGAGLGLSVSRNIITMHKGLIDVESQIGKGTKVIVTLKVD